MLFGSVLKKCLALSCDIMTGLASGQLECTTLCACLRSISRGTLYCHTHICAANVDEACCSVLKYSAGNVH